MNDDNINKILEYVKQDLIKNDFVSVNIHRHKDGFDVEVNVV